MKCGLWERTRLFSGLISRWMIFSSMDRCGGIKALAKNNRAFLICMRSCVCWPSRFSSRRYSRIVWGDSISANPIMRTKCFFAKINREGLWKAEDPTLERCRASSMIASFFLSLDDSQARRHYYQIFLDRYRLVIGGRLEVWKELCCGVQMVLWIHIAPIWSSLSAFVSWRNRSLLLMHRSECMLCLQTIIRNLRRCTSLTICSSSFIPAPRRIDVKW